MRVLIVDDHPLIREGLVRVVRAVDGVSGVIEAGDAVSAREAAADMQIKLILLDLAVPGAVGLNLLEALRRDRPDVPVVIVSASDSRGEVLRSIDAGAMGFISKRSSTPVLLSALRLVLAGGVYVPPHVIDTDSDIPSVAAGDIAADPATRLATLGLTGRQADVLALVVQGKPNKEICRELRMAEGTVKTHITAILRTLKVSNRTQALFTVSRLGLRLASPMAGSKNASLAALE